MYLHTTVPHTRKGEPYTWLGLYEDGAPVSPRFAVWLPVADALVEYWDSLPGPVPDPDLAHHIFGHMIEQASEGGAVAAVHDEREFPVTLDHKGLADWLDAVRAKTAMNEQLRTAGAFPAA